MYQIPPAFIEFISPDCKRDAFIQDYLNKAGLQTSLMPMDGKKHIYVNFPRQQYNPMFKVKTVIAHYDRIGIGANDNSAAVFCLMEWAAAISKMPGFHNIRLIFTDGEELGKNAGVKEQGAFNLAQLFKKFGITSDDIYVFDCMGRGDVPILAQTIIPPNVSTRFLTAISGLEQRAKQLLQSASPGKWFSLPCNYSDNASFIANGIPAVAFTLLPAEDVQTVIKTGTCPSWQLFHTPADNLASLTPYSFQIFHNILFVLALIKTPCK